MIQAAIPIFAERGPDLPVIDDFAKAAGVSRGTFYNYFATTRELLDACLVVLFDDVIELIAPRVADQPNPVIRLATAARLFYRKASAEPVFRGFLGSVSGVGKMAARHGRADLIEAREQGLITIPDLALAEAVAFGIMVFALRAERAGVSDPARADEVVRTILIALQVAPELIEQALQVPLPPLSADENVGGGVDLG